MRSVATGTPDPMIRFGILGAARIVPDALLEPCAAEPRAQIGCIAARDPSRAKRFAQEHGIARVHESYREVIEDPSIQAIYNPLPISLHHRWTLEALEAGKHVLCEKAFASNAREAEAMAQGARQADRVLMEAFHYRYHPVFVHARDIVASGRLGKIREVEATFHAPVTDPDDIRMHYETAGGVTMDIGCYPLSWVRHITGEEPTEVSARAVLGPPHVDVCLEAELGFQSGIVAKVSGDMRPGVSLRAELVVRGERGTLSIDNPVAPQRGHRIELTLDGRTTSEQLDLRTTFAYQLDAFLDAVLDGEPMHTDAEDAVQQMHLIDRCYEAAGLPLRGLAL